MDEVRRLRLEKGWSQNELAYHAKLAPSVISLIETGKREPNATTLRKLAGALEVRIPDLFEESGSGKARRRSSAQPTLLNGLEDERREDSYQAWLDFVNRYADRWEARIAAGDFDLGNVNEFIATLEDLGPSLNRLGLQEKQEQPPEYGMSFGPIMGEAIGRLMDLLNPLIEAGTAKFDNSELEQLRRKRAEREAALGEAVRRGA